MHQSIIFTLHEEMQQKSHCINDRVKVDDGVSGTTFQREGFMAMMDDIEEGKVGTVITKDLSHLGRDYLKTGEYIEDHFSRSRCPLYCDQ